jgi:hypothetical protein
MRMVRIVGGMPGPNGPPVSIIFLKGGYLPINFLQILFGYTRDFL